MNENDDPKIRELLKKSPPLTPPESFYRGVMEKIEQQKSPAPAPTPTPWYWGVPGRLVASACLVMLIVIATRQSKTMPPEREEPADVAVPETRSANKVSSIDKLAESRPVQKRLERSIVDYVDHPSPFEEVDEADRAQLQSRAKAMPMAATVGAMAELKDAAPEKIQEWLGASSGIVQPRNVVVRTGKEWTTLWQEHSHSVPPRVDFDQQMVIGIFGGEKTTSGYNLEILEISEKAGQIVVTYKEGPAGMAQVMTQPYVMRVIPKSNLSVTFQKLN